MATQLCLTLGYHRQPLADDRESKASSLFWFAYMLDKGLALRLGRPSTIKDCDITNPPHTMSRSDMPYPWFEALGLWVSHAEVQGLVYEQLYSADGLARPPDARAESAKLLAARTGDILARSVNLRRTVSTPTPGTPFVAKPPGELHGRRSLGGAPFEMMSISLFLKSDEVLYKSSQALIYRAIPAAPGLANTLSTECIEAARAAFRAHQEFMELTEASVVMKTVYLHW